MCMSNVYLFTFLKINVKYSPNRTETVAKFSVSENVLPKFEVTLSPDTPTFLMKDASSAALKFCARYTHGGRVKGRMDLELVSSYRPPQWGARLVTVRIRKPNVTIGEDGCGEARLNSTEASRLTANWPSFKATATVTEDGTAAAESASATFKVKDVPFELSFGAGSSSSSRSHVVAAGGGGGFPLLQRLTARSHGGAPVVGEELVVCARLFTSIQQLRDRLGPKGHLLYAYDEDQYIQLAESVLKIKHG